MATAQHWAVIAELPLGAYRGRLSDGAVDPVPAPARLHGALLQAAAQGTRATSVGGRLAPSDQDIAALEWLERNPPDGVRIPPTRRTPASLIVYRDEGTIRKEGNAPAPTKKKLGKSFAGTVAVSAPFAWTWSSEPPQPVRESLTALASDVSHLGTSESPARLRVGTACPTHRLRADASRFDPTPDAYDLDVAMDGRARSLMSRYALEQGQPSAAQDRYATSEGCLSRTGWPEHRAVARYVADREPLAPALWDRVLYAALVGAPVRDDERVAVAVAAHRALIRIIREDVPSLVTGSYGPGTPPPANRMSIQVLTAETAALAGLPADHDHLLVLIPHGALPADVEVVERAFERLSRLTTRPRGSWDLGGGKGNRPGAAFWSPPAQGRVRLWRTDPVAVPEVRAPRRGPWTLQETVAHAVALVARDHRRADGSLLMGVRDDGATDDRKRDLAAQMTAHGVRVVDASFVRTDASPYVHKVPEQGVVRPYRATLSLGRWAEPRWIVAVGQSRHLGGGLLVPVDVPADLGTKE